MDERFEEMARDFNIPLLRMLGGVRYKLIKVEVRYNELVPVYLGPGEILPTEITGAMIDELEALK